MPAPASATAVVAAALDVEIKLVRVGLLGFGTVGRAFAELLLERRAAIEDVAGVGGLNAALFTGDATGVVTADDVDLVVELIGGDGPVKDLVLAALSAGKPVVTANKELVGTNGPSSLPLRTPRGRTSCSRPRRWPRSRFCESPRWVTSSTATPA